MIFVLWMCSLLYTRILFGLKTDHMHPYIYQDNTFLLLQTRKMMVVCFHAIKLQFNMHVSPDSEATNSYCDLDLWPPKSNQWQIWRNTFKVFLVYCVHKNSPDGPPATAITSTETSTMSWQSFVKVGLDRLFGVLTKCFFKMWISMWPLYNKKHVPV